MFAFLSENFGTILVSALILLAVILIVARMVRRKKQGMSCSCDCGCSCEDCPAGGAASK